ncbi:hypothetical protein MN116_003038 [Schistosoma mekongi]|uniref:Uncharacterized protein n=1 Tax=Schistosoma mekongi TaxID=38744 RepID=A0AAE1ZI50_SCHME|nr:hypothetical protein MN116_003038 [Schistosoma mekongi]
MTNGDYKVKDATQLLVACHDALMISRSYISNINWCQFSRLFPVNSFILSQCKWHYSVQPRSQNDNIEDSSEFLERLNAAKDNHPGGSALYQDNNHFSPVVFPDPLFNWEALKISVNARRQAERFNIDKIMNLKNQIDGIHERITAAKQKRVLLRSHYEQNKQDSEEIKTAARTLRNEQKSLELSFKTLDCEFQNDSLQLPNVIHSLTPVNTMGSENVIKYYDKSDHVNEKLLWSNLADDCYNEIIGTYYTGRLAQIEYTHMYKVNDYWLNRMDQGQVTNYPVHLSDIVRGPALEATSWPNTKSAIRLRPSKSDMLFVEDSNTKLGNWLINPYTTDYLVGSASLAAFSAYLMLHKANLFTNSSLRLISKGSIYALSSECTFPYNDTSCASSDDLKLNRNFKPPFHQSKQISILELTKDWNQCEAGFHVLVDELIRFWQHYQPGWSYKLTYTEASNLYPCEMLRAILYSDIKTVTDNSISIPLASVSLVGDWISRRIMAKLMKTDKNLYPCMVFMNAWNFQCLLDSFKQIGYLEEHSSSAIG